MNRLSLAALAGLLSMGGVHAGAPVVKHGVDIGGTVVRRGNGMGTIELTPDWFRPRVVSLARSGSIHFRNQRQRRKRARSYRSHNHQAQRGRCR